VASEIRRDNMKLKIWGFIWIAFLFSSPTYGEEFECVRCYSGAVKLFAEFANPSPMEREDRGVIECKNKNSILHNKFDHMKRLQAGVHENREGFLLYRIYDQDDDSIVGWGTYDGLDMSIKFTAGTGKYSGIKGSFVSKRSNRDHEALEEKLYEHLDTIENKPEPEEDSGGPIMHVKEYSWCRTYVGKIELKK